MNSISRCKFGLSQSLSIRLILCFSLAILLMLRPRLVMERDAPFIELSMAANRLCRRVLCINGVTSDRHFDKTCFAFMAFTRGNFCLAINLITKCHECSFLFYLPHYLLRTFCGDSSDSDPIISNIVDLTVTEQNQLSFCTDLNRTRCNWKYKVTEILPNMMKGVDQRTGETWTAYKLIN